MKLACPNCGSNIKYKIGTNLVYCEQCNSTSEISTLDQSLKQSLSYDVKEYTCSSCGAKIITIDDSIINACNYCGSTNLIVNDLKSKINNSKIMPFQYSKQAFINAFKVFISENHLSNSSYFKEDAITKIVGLYIPVSVDDYNIEFDSKGTLKFFKENEYELELNKEYEYSYNANYKSTICYDKVKDLQDYIITNLLPFEVDKARTFSPYYMAGMSCAKISDYKNDKIKFISKDIEKLLIKNANNTFLGVNDFKAIENKLSFSSMKTQEYYFPIWLCSYSYDGAIYSFAMNGQNGKIISNLPKDNDKFNTTYSAKKKNNIFDEIIRNSCYGLLAFVFLVVVIGHGALKNGQPFFHLIPIILAFVVAIVIINIVFNSMENNRKLKKKMDQSLSNFDYEKAYNFKLQKIGKEKKSVNTKIDISVPRDTIIIDGEEIK